MNAVSLFAVMWLSFASTSFSEVAVAVSLAAQFSHQTLAVMFDRRPLSVLRFVRHELCYIECRSKIRPATYKSYIHTG